MAGCHANGRTLAIGLAAMFAATGLTAQPALAQQADSPFHWQPAADDGQPHPWAILLPGGGGMAVFQDTDHYYRWARWLNARGIDVLLVDHVTSRDALAIEGESQGQWQARLAVQGLEQQRALGRMDGRCKGMVIGWSLGGEGALTLASLDAPAIDGLAAVVGFYPSVRFQPRRNLWRVPVLTFLGEDDNVTPLADLEALSGYVQGSARFDIRIYSLAHHGFDVAGLVEPVTWNGGTFAYSDWAAADAAAVLENEMTYWGVTGEGACALD